MIYCQSYFVPDEKMNGYYADGDFQRTSGIRALAMRLADWVASNPDRPFSVRFEEESKLTENPFSVNDLYAMPKRGRLVTLRFDVQEAQVKELTWAPAPVPAIGLKPLHRVATTREITSELITRFKTKISFWKKD